MVAIIDYDAGNIRSVENAMKFLGGQALLTRDPETILSADHVILPGVGAFGDAMGRLRSCGLDRTIREVCSRGIPFLGICLGLQLLFDSSEESPGVAGLGILPGKVIRFPVDAQETELQQESDQRQARSQQREHGQLQDSGPQLDFAAPKASRLHLKVPEIGWNSLSFPHPGRLFQGVPEGSYVYFVHSYYLKAEDPAIVTATSDYGVTFDASVESGNVFACQFHPEKSERVGMQILRNFLAVGRE